MGSVVARGVAKTLRIDRSAARADRNAAVVIDVGIRGEAERAAVEREIAGRKGRRNRAEIGIGRDDNRAADNRGAASVGIAAGQSERAWSVLDEARAAGDDRVNRGRYAGIDCDVRPVHRQRRAGDGVAVGLERQAIHRLRRGQRHRAGGAARRPRCCWPPTARWPNR